MGTMKKRMLALVLALVIVGGLGGQGWAEMLPAVASPSPEVSTQPEESATPEESAAPQESTAPAESETPEESTAPEEDGTDEAPVETPILDEPYALPGVEDFAVTEAAPWSRRARRRRSRRARPAIRAASCARWGCRNLRTSAPVRAFVLVHRAQLPGARFSHAVRGLPPGR